MAGTYLFVGPGGSIYWIDPVADFASLPASAPTGTVVLTIDDGTLYFYDGGWSATAGGGGAFVSSVTDTNSIDLTVAVGALSADLLISGNAASTGFFKATTTIQSTSSVGLHVELPEATGAQTGVLKAADFTTFNAKVAASRAINTTAPLTGGGDLSADRTIAIPVATAIADGYLSSADWSTFNAKEPAISAGTTDDYWRGDKSFQVLQVSALKPIADGSSAASGKIGEILTGTQATATGTGVGATGTYGAATSVSLTSGVWAISGVAAFKENGAVLTTSLTAGISDSATGVGIGAFDITVNPNTFTGSEDMQFPTPEVIVSIGSTTTYYLNTRFYYTSGSPQHYGRIRARRIR